MEFDSVLRRRRMIRSFAPTAVPEEAVAAILRAAMRAPSAGFSQGVSMLVLQDPTDREKFWTLTDSSAEPNAWLRGMQTAPVLLLVWTSRQAYLDRYAQPDKGWSPAGQTGTHAGRDRWSAPYWFVDAGMASMSALLCVVDLGLGACFFGVPPEQIGPVRDGFGVPDEQLSVGAIAIGYPDPPVGPTGSPTTRQRREQTTLVHRGRWQVGAAQEKIDAQLNS